MAARSGARNGPTALFIDNPEPSFPYPFFVDDERDHDDDGTSPRWRPGWVIATAFVLMVVVARWPAAIPPPAPIHRLAVLPLTGDPAEDYLADGLTAALIDELALFDDLRVTAHTSSALVSAANLSPAEIRRDLGVDVLVTGSVRRLGGKIRISVELVHAPSGQHLWAASFERASPRILELQREVTESLHLRVHDSLRDLSAPQPAEEDAGASFPYSGPSIELDTAAHEAYLRGLHLARSRTPESLEEALAELDRAVAAEPGFADAVTARAEIYVALARQGAMAPGMAYSQARRAAQNALALNERAPRARTLRAIVLYYSDWSFAAAEAEFLRAIALAPSDALARQWYARFLTTLGRFDEALEQVKIWQELDPLAYSHREAAVILRLARRDDLAERVLGTPVETAATEADDTMSTVDRAILLVAEGGLDDGLEELERAYERREPELLRIVSDPAFDPLRGDPRFRDLLARVGLPRLDLG